MVNLSLKQVTLSIITSRQSKAAHSVLFRGEQRDLQPFFKTGLTPIQDDSFYLNRNDIDPRLQITAFIGAKKRHPLLITGFPGSGKSMILSGLVQQLRLHDYPVKIIEQEGKPHPSCLTEQDLQKLAAAVATHEAQNPTKPFFLFIDEFHLAMDIEEDVRPEAQTNASASVLYGLYKFLEGHPNVQLLASTTKDGIEHHNKTGQQWLWDHFFPEENRIMMPSPETLPKRTVIDMVNRNLGQAGFEPMPLPIQKRLLELEQPLIPRELINAVWWILEKDKLYRDRPANCMQTLPEALWQKLIPQYLRIHKREQKQPGILQRLGLRK